MNNKLFIGSLSFDTKEEGLAQAFAAAGTVTSAKVMTDKFTGRPRGFGFVEMATEEEAKKAIEMFDGQTLDGRTIAVSIARPLEDRPPRRPGTGGGFGGGRSSAGGRGGFGGGNGGHSQY